MNSQSFEKANRDRIQAVDNSFGTAGRPLYNSGRVLMGEGRLMKQGRRHSKPQPKDFYLFNDILVYGSIILNGRWHKKQKILHLEDIQLEDMEDGLDLVNQWLIRTPRKSFFVSASSLEEKQAWMDHIENCRLSLLRERNLKPNSVFASSWIPDKAACKCMRCLGTFTTTKRRHHCRKCGFVVCKVCSDQRARISNIHPTKKLRVCRLCHVTMEEENPQQRERGDSIGKSSEEEISDQEEGGEITPLPAVSRWGRMSIYDYPRSIRV
ncbi:pleckstrin homology domain-containing family F member 2-like [Xyrichtys novacula]|uniref:Pleckstrin homology domain-containing family F member 2-like n=1 Tax=Xyrichtys novacula TaxID=13765 RepID=A0AAV1GQG3_XYRNO|nr:pleckstrin homology domain-containing family F member 2-like [Xyrichtys novacula]